MKTLKKPLLGMAIAFLSVAVTAVPTPNNMNVVWVGEDVVQNGVPMNIQRFDSPDSVEGVMTYYRKQWGNKGHGDIPGFVESQFDQWYVISRIEGDKNIVIQARVGKRGGAEGFISKMDVNASPGFNKITQTFPKLDSSQVVSSTESHDFNAEATTIILTNPHSVSKNAAFYEKKITGMGWRLAKRFHKNGSEILFFNGPDSKIEITIGRAEVGQTTVFANVVKG